jgi:hypothetical protein
METQKFRIKHGVISLYTILLVGGGHVKNQLMILTAVQ